MKLPPDEKSVQRGVDLGGGGPQRPEKLGEGVWGRDEVGRWRGEGPNIEAGSAPLKVAFSPQKPRETHHPQAWEAGPTWRTETMNPRGFWPTWLWPTSMNRISYTRLH